MSLQSPPESPTLRRHRGSTAAGAGGARARPKAAPLPPLSPPPPPAVVLDDDPAAAATSSSPRPHTLDCCVRVLVVHCEPSYSLPWSKKRSYQSSSSGFIVAGAEPEAAAAAAAAAAAGAGKRKPGRNGPSSSDASPQLSWLPGHRLIATNAHCVQDATSIKVQRRDSPDRYLAEIVAVSTDADLALLTVRDSKFWVDAPSVSFAEEVPRLQERVLVAGFPVGGAGLSLSSGVVSRVEVLPYAHSGVELLACQCDSAINAGNSGGPAFDREGYCIGVAFQSLRADEADGVGYVIPIPIVKRFFSDVARHGRYTGFAALGVEWQKIESRALRRALRLPDGGPGVLVRRVDPTAPAASVLRRGDVILALDGVDIASDGTVPFRPGERVAFSYLISQHFCGDEVSLKVLRAPPGALGDDGDDGDAKDGKDNGGASGSSSARRDKKPQNAAASVPPVPLPLPSRKPELLKVRLARPQRLVPYHLEQGASPSYFVIGGLAFTPLTAGYLRSEFGRDYESEAPVSLVAALTHGVVKRPGEQVVLLAQVLAHAANVGYEDVCAAPVRSVNGTRVFSLKELVKETEAALSRGDAYLQFALAHGDVVVLSAAEAQKATPEILEAHAIAKDRSADLVEDGGGSKEGKEEDKEEEKEGGGEKGTSRRGTRKKEEEEAGGGGKRARKK